MTAEQHFQLISDWLFHRYGKHPEPRRSYLEWQEVLDLMRENLVSLHTTLDLWIGGYPGKWKRGIESAIAEGLDPATLSFWMKARDTYLALGGGYLEGCDPPAKGRRGVGK